jgi:uncharacterized protein YciI
MHLEAVVQTSAAFREIKEETMFFFCKRFNLKAPGQRTATLDGHLAWMKKQHESCAIVLSGPSPDLKFGMYLIRASCRDEAERIAASDPYTVCGDSTYELQQWDIRQIMGVGPFNAAALGLADRGL